MPDSAISTEGILGRVSEKCQWAIGYWEDSGFVRISGPVCTNKEIPIVGAEVLHIRETLRKSGATKHVGGV